MFNLRIMSVLGKAKTARCLALALAIAFLTVLPAPTPAAGFQTCFQSDNNPCDLEVGGYAQFKTNHHVLTGYNILVFPATGFTGNSGSCGPGGIQVTSISRSYTSLNTGWDGTEFFINVEMDVYNDRTPFTVNYTIQGYLNGSPMTADGTLSITPAWVWQLGFQNFGC